ncbi:Peptidase M23B [metagenome]|uniref:Peptidase M23B n=1 Tax=metagenome TaxID=256318 RepID=A0A2P2CBX1_9ZZZZ
MRFFPRAQRRHAAVVTVAGAMAIALLANPLASAQDDDHLKAQKHQVEHDLKAAHGDLEESSAELRAATAKLLAARAELETAQGVLAAARAKVSAAKILDQQMQDRLEEAEARLERARHDLVVGQQQVEDQRTDVVNQVTDYYEQGDPRLLGLASVLDAEDPNDITRRLSLMDTVVGEQNAAYDELAAAEVLLTVRETQIEGAKQDVAERRREAAAHLTEMRGLESAAEDAAASVRTLVAARADAMTHARAIRRADRAKLAALQAREARIKQRILAAARAAARKGSGYNGRTNGLFNKPVDGPITSPFGYRVHPIYGYYSLHDGTDFGAGCGQSLWSVANGTVTDEYYSDVWGNRLYVSLGNFNGKNVTVIYNHLSGYRARVGERVARGETIGYVGTTGWSTGCHLHFTVMVNGNPVDPMNWIGS